MLTKDELHIWEITCDNCGSGCDVFVTEGADDAYFFCNPQCHQEWMAKNNSPMGDEEDA